MRRRLPAPRLLPVTMLAMAALFGVKSLALLRLAAPAQAAATAAAPATVATPAAPTVPTTAPTTAPANAPALVPEPAGLAPRGPAPAGEPQISASELALLQDLRRRGAELDARATALATREHVAAAAQTRLDARLDQLGRLQARLESLEAARKGRDEASWQGLVRVYEAMKPKDAAVIFDDLDMPVLLQVMDRMRDRKAAPVLAAMQPERARELTAELAELRSRANQIPNPAPDPPAASASRPAP